MSVVLLVNNSAVVDAKTFTSMSVANGSVVLVDEKRLDNEPDVNLCGFSVGLDTCTTTRLS